MSIEDVESKILSLLESREKAETTEIDGEYSVIIGAVKRLESFERIKSTPVQCESISTTEEGAEIVKYGSPEHILHSLLDAPLDDEKIQEMLQKTEQFKNKESKEVVEFIKKGKNNGLRMKVLKMNNKKLERNSGTATDTTRHNLQNISTLSSDEVSELKKRKLVTQKKITHYTVTKGERYHIKETAPSDITVEMINSMEVVDNLKKYNFNIVAVPAKYGGSLHPLSLQRDRVKQIFLHMGFEEMDAGKYIESSFWNFDALFQPQRHPSRNEQDTFFMADPAAAADPDAEYLEKVKRVHTVGEYGSLGYQAPWSLDESRKNVLRTHTTAVTTRLLYKIMKEKKSDDINYSRKYFSIDRVFRNETLDATHLAEFHQVEGIIMGRGLTISHLMGFMEEFFKQLGINKVKYKPAYNPYTEPSLEVFGYHEEMQKWMEIGNSGLFRPEMLLPMGYPEDVRVIGWGISLERPVMIDRKMNNIRDLVGHKVDLSFIRNGLFKQK
ncbi:phenylalanyl-tRNA synthetase alpha chain [Nematocida minor]|uniref:phenylalanyl-tRNA synthetase alpha chain n=1 Tax=Nematocida minor TaxID=1912983 RepID=UPI00221EABEF|nr:phenylalanyl-tRNA synthetase alpha chain [Nematocida minor]KAI5191691.1 phenylalanyl-tRNA synthetase alpha chain [Nematocida minor]